MAVTINGTTGILAPDIGIDGTTLTVDAVNDRVGIGTTSPATTLDVSGTGQFKNNGSSLKIESVPGNNFTQIQFKNDGGSFYVGRENNSGNWFATGSNYASVLRSDGAYPLIFSVNGANRLSIATDGKVTAAFGVVIGGDANNGTAEGLQLNTSGFIQASRGSGVSALWAGYTQGSSTQTSRIDNDGDAHFLGNIGIGTNNPQEKLHVLGTSDFIVDTDTTGLRFGSYGEYDIALVTGRNTSSGSSRLYIENGDGEALRITSAGKVGINCTPTSKLSLAVGSGGEYFLDVKGTAARQWGLYYDQNSWMDSTFRIDEFNSNGAATTRFTITNSGKIGIGTDAPNEKLDVRGKLYLNNGSATYIDAASSNGLVVTNPTAIRFELGSERLRITSDGLVGISDSDPRTGLTINKYGTRPTTNNNTYSMPAGRWVSTWSTGTSNSVDYWAGFGGSGYGVSSATVNIALSPNHNNTSQQAGMYIAGEATSASSSDFTIGKIVSGSVVGPSDVAGNQRATKSELMRITHDGKIGAGTANPRRHLHLHETATATVGFQMTNGGTGESNDSQGFQLKVGSDGHAEIAQMENSNLRFFTNATERIRITSTGQLNVGNNLNQQNYLFSVCAGGSAGASPVVFENNHAGHYGGLIVKAGVIDRECRLQSAWGDSFMTFYTEGSGQLGERLRITSGGNVGIGTDNPAYELSIYGTGAVRNEIVCTNNNAAGAGIYLRTMNGGSTVSNATLHTNTTGDLLIWSGTSGASERLRIKSDGKVGINTTGPASRLHVRDGITYGKTSYASASTGSGQTRPPGTFKWDNITPAGGSGRGYRGWVQSGDAYPNASSYFDLLVRNSGFYRVTVKRSHSSANASVATMLIYGLANSGGGLKPVVYISGITSSGSGTGTAQTGHGYGSSNPVANFYWTVVSYNINTHDTIIRIRTNTSNNQGIVALVEEI